MSDHDTHGLPRPLEVIPFDGDQWPIAHGNRLMFNTICATKDHAEELCRIANSYPALEAENAKLEARVKELEEALRAADGYENGIIREFEEEREASRDCVAELWAHLRKIHDRAHSWNNIPACSDIEQMAAQALGLKGGA